MNRSTLERPSFFPPLQMGMGIPAKPKYELGQLIRTAEITRILYMMRIEECKEALSRTNAETPSEERDEKILQLETQVLGIMQMLNECNKIYSPPFKKSPIDISRSPITFEHGAYPSEQMKTLTLSRRDLTEDKTVELLVNQFVSHIFVQNDSSSFISEDQIAEMTRQINQALESDKEVMIIGSQVTLSNVKIMHPVLSEEAISETLLAESNFCVLTQEELGGVFLGFEARTAVQEPVTDSDESTEFSMPSLPWFISEGAFPKIGSSFKTLSLWNIYNSWKETIQADPQGARPIRYKYQPWQIVLENSRRFHTSDSA